MKKWLLGIGLLLVVLVGGTCYRMIWAVRNTPDHASQVIHGTQEDVFASLTHADSMRRWMAQGAQVLPADRGPLNPGDTLTILEPAGEVRPGVAGDAEEWVLVVQEMRAPDLLVTTQLTRDSTGALLVAQVWRDSLTAMGDSTRVETKVILGPAGSMPRLPGDTSSAMRTVDYLALGLGVLRAQIRLGELADYMARRTSPPTP